MGDLPILSRHAGIVSHGSGLARGARMSDLPETVSEPKGTSGNRTRRRTSVRKSDVGRLGGGLPSTGEKQ